MIFVLLHGWGLQATKWASNNGIDRAAAVVEVQLHLPQRRKYPPRWRLTDDKWIATICHQLMSRHPGQPLVLGGFSDGARAALRAANYVSPAGVIYHSGRYVATDILDHFLPWPLLVIEGRDDWFRAVGIVTAHNLYERYASDDRAAYYQHDGRHEWGHVNQIVLPWVVKRGKDG